MHSASRGVRLPNQRVTSMLHRVRTESIIDHSISTQNNIGDQNRGDREIGATTRISGQDFLDEGNTAYANKESESGNGE
jgi:hypothetical protein